MRDGERLCLGSGAPDDRAAELCLLADVGIVELSGLYAPGPATYAPLSARDMRAFVPIGVPACDDMVARYVACAAGALADAPAELDLALAEALWMTDAANEARPLLGDLHTTALCERWQGELSAYEAQLGCTSSPAP